MKKFFCGVDLGGTTLKIGIVDGNGNIMVKIKEGTLPHKGPDYILNRIKDNISLLLKKSSLNEKNLSGIGIAVPGFIDEKRGRILSLTNLPYWEGVPLGKLMREGFSTPIKIINDATAAAYGEYLYGSGRGTNNFIYMTISTGIGGGIIIEGKPYFGTSHGAGEIGHMVIDINGERCNCGNYGCFEVMASGTAMAKFAQKAIEAGENSTIKILAAANIIKAEHVFSAAKLGDKLAKDIVDKEAFYLGIGISNIINIFNPEKITLGGGISNQWNTLHPKIMKIINKRAIKENTQICEIVKTELKDDAGIIGAAALCFIPNNK